MDEDDDEHLETLLVGRTWLGPVALSPWVTVDPCHNFDHYHDDSEDGAVYKYGVDDFDGDDVHDDFHDNAHDDYDALGQCISRVTNLAQEDTAIVGQVLKNLICQQLMYL